MNIMFEIFLSLILFIVVSTVYIIKNSFTPPQKNTLVFPENVDLEYEKLNIDSNIYKLNGFYITSGKNIDNKLVILVHGWGHNLTYMFPFANSFNQNNYDVVAFDLKGHGKSEKKGITSMYHLKNDILSVIKYVKSRYPDKVLYLLGFSMGGACSILALTETEKIKGAVICSSFANVFETIKMSLKGIGIFKTIGTKLVFLFFEWYNKVSYKTVDPQKQIQKLKIPVMLIHGTEDKYVDISNFKILLNKGNKKNITGKIFEGSNHNGILNNIDVHDAAIKYFDAILENNKLTS